MSVSNFLSLSNKGAVVISARLLPVTQQDSNMLVVPRILWGQGGINREQRFGLSIYSQIQTEVCPGAF